MTKEQDQRRIDGMLQERIRYQRSEREDQKEQIAAIDVELKRLGYEFPEAPKGRSAGHKSTADEKGKDVA